MVSRKGDFEPQYTEKWQCGDPYKYPIEAQGDHWEKLLNPLLEKDRVQCEAWKDEVQNLLIFAGLFSAVLSAFVVVSYPTLQPDQNETMISLLARIATRLDNPLNATLPADPVNPALFSNAPTPSSIRINAFWFISLVLSLTAALIGIISLQWLREHQQYPSSIPARQKFALLNMRTEGLVAWYVPQVFSSLPLLLQLALLLFFVGLIDFLLATSLSVAIPVIVFISIPFAFLILSTTIPAFQVFVFCLPLANARRVPQQAPYKSTQSRLFGQLLTFSSHAFRFFSFTIHAIYSLFCLWPSLRQRYRGPHQETSDVNADQDELERVNEEVYETLLSSSWLSFDKDWIVMRDAYAKCIFDKELRMKAGSLFHSKQSAPFYDLTRGIASAVFEYAQSDPAILCSAYVSVQELTSSIIGDKAATCFRYRGESYNRYLQTLLTIGDLTKPPPTFCALLKNPRVEFLQDENMFIFLSLCTQPPPFILQHFAELHIRIANYLFPGLGDARRPLQDPLVDFPTYPDFQIYLCYGKAPWQEAKYGSCFSGAISEQFSHFITAYLETLASPSLGEDVILSSLYNYKVGEFFEYTIVRQSSEKIPFNLDLLSKSIRNNAGILNKKSDLLFYISSFYTHCLWHSNPEFGASKTYKDVRAFLPVLRQYLNTRGTPDADLREHLGVPSFDDDWWGFLNRQEAKPDAREDNKLLSSTGTGSNADNPRNAEPLACPVRPGLPTDQLGDNDMAKLNPHAEDLV